MIPTRWSSAFAILRRRLQREQEEALAWQERWLPAPQSDDATRLRPAADGARGEAAPARKLRWTAADERARSDVP